MSKRNLRRACAAGLLLLAACGDDAAGPTTPVDVTGTWNAAGDASGYAFTLILTLTQTGTSVTGTGQILNIVSGTITGTVTGNKLNFQLTLPALCAGTFTGTATQSGRRLDGSFSGSAQCLGSVQATFQGLKQS